MDSHSIRSTFLDFFAARGHTIRPAASLIPVDPTLLLTNAGMVPFKPYFLGDETAPYPRAATVQKVVRTIDIDIIGTTARHMSLFEMMGNFSFGDYFKADAMRWGNELLIDGFGLDPERLWYTAYEEDDEAAHLWVDEVGAPPERVQRGGKDNFWQMGVPGPCGPCAEIFYDRGVEFGDDGGPIGGGEDRFVEVWNLVFMQYVQDRPYHVVGDLPAKNVDTGMGLERLAMLVQDVDSVFDVDTVRPVRDAAAEFTGTEYGADPAKDISLRILADHGRAMTMLIGDQVMPSNEGRGYVLRRLIRRAIRHAWQLGGEGLITPRLVEASVGAMGSWYPDLVERHDVIDRIVTHEEERFRRTLATGIELLDGEIENLPEEAPLPGPVAFKLHDTYGFPIELTNEIVAERGRVVDQEGFDTAMAVQRKRAKDNWKGGDAAARTEFYRAIFDSIGSTSFVGYENDRVVGTILAIVRDGEPVEFAETGQDVEIFVDQTPFYAESGGQVGDEGTIEVANGIVAVTDVQHAIQGFHGHRGRVERGTVQVGEPATLVIDGPRRRRTRKSHTGTHVIHQSLRDVLGDHASQAGSLVGPGRLRFDFSHFQGLDRDELTEIERLTNQRLIDNGRVHTTVTSQDEAKAMGALAFFGDKYGDRVRVVQVGEFSTEFCGGTHTSTAGEVGPLIVVSEGSIGSNIRRIEALTGEAAYEHLLEVRSRLDHVGRTLQTQPASVPERVEGLIARVSELEDEIDVLRRSRRSELVADLAATVKKVNGVDVVIASVGELPSDQLRQLAMGIRDRVGEGVVVVGSSSGGKGSLVATVTPSVVDIGVSAADLLKVGATMLGGGGSRDPQLAQAGGPRGDLIDEAVEAVRRSVTDNLVS